MSKGSFVTEGHINGDANNRYKTDNRYEMVNRAIAWLANWQSLNLILKGQSMTTSQPGAADASVTHIPVELTALRRWVLWRWARRGDKLTKVPISAYRLDVPADVTDSSTWASFDETSKHLGSTYGCGFVFTEDDDICGIDLDHCRNPETGELTSWAQDILQAFPTYAEVSPSQTGVKIFLRGRIPTDSRQRRSFDGLDSFGGVAQIEVYESRRFFTVTGTKLESAPNTVHDCEASLRRLCMEHLTNGKAGTRETEILAASKGSGCLNKDQVLERCRAATNSAKFEALWCGKSDDYGSQSEADLALCNMLAFFAGDNPKVIDALFRESGLFRSKWDEQHGALTYGEKTIARATERQNNVGPHSDRKAPDREDSQAAQLVKLILNHELWHTPDGRAYVTVSGREHMPLDSSRFKQWLRWLAHTQLRRSASKQAIADAAAQIESVALFEGRAYEDHLRIASHDDAIYIDLCNEKWQAVEVTADGWRVVDNPPVRFRRTDAMEELPVPQTGGSLEPLRELLNVSDTTWPLFVAWLVAAMRPTGPYPVLSFFGEAGTGKSTTAKVARKLIDPNKAPLRGDVRQRHDLMITANNNWILAFDNLSRLPNWLSDAFCCLSTGGGFGTRQLYTDHNEIVFNAVRPLILTGVSEVATRGDLVDRELLLELEPIDEKDRLPESEFWAAFDAHHAHFFGALLDAVVTALRNSPHVSLPASPRLADFAHWATAAEPALGLESGEFMRLYDANRRDANMGVLEDSPIGGYIVAIAGEHGVEGWHGTPATLLDRLEGRANERDKQHKHWPKSAAWLSRRLREISTNLRAQGVEVEQTHVGRGDGKQRQIVLRCKS